MAPVLSKATRLGCQLLTRRSKLQQCSAISTVINNQVSDQKIKPYESVPTKKIPFIPRSWNLIVAGGASQLHNYCDKLHDELGPIFKELLGNHELVFIADTRMIQSVILNEGTHPQHNVPEAWMLYNTSKKIERGLFFQVGEPWLKIRRSLNKVMLSDPGSTTRFSRDILKISEQLIDSWLTKERCDESGSIHVTDIKSELCKWSIETTGYILFGDRMRCVADGVGLHKHDDRADALVRNVANMFNETANFQVLPCRLAQRLNLPSWRRFERASDEMLRTAQDYSNEFISLIKSNVSGGAEKPSMVKDLIDLNQLTDEEISRSLVDLVIAAADTTSNSVQWILYLIAKHQDVQARLLTEVETFIKNAETIDWDNLRQLAPYLNATIKEAMRLYPTAPFLARTLDRDIILDEYRIPAGQPIVFSLYTTSRMAKYFENPLEFRPERWLRRNSKAEGKQTKSLQEQQPISAADGSQNSCAYARLPFGVGARMCIGRRAAELEMSLLVAAFVIKCNSFLPKEMQNLKVKLKMILSPDKSIDLLIKPRQK